jgi:hypothetical protein
MFWSVSFRLRIAYTWAGLIVRVRATDCLHALSLSASPGSGGREGSGTGILKSVMCRMYRRWSVRDRQNVRSGLMVPGMTGSPSRYDVTVTIARDGGYLPGPPEFALAAEQAAFSRNAMS